MPRSKLPCCEEGHGQETVAGKCSSQGESSPQLMTRGRKGDEYYNHKKLNSANNHMSLEADPSSGKECNPDDILILVL